MLAPDSSTAMKELLSPNQVAKAIGVSESSLKRWADQGRIASVRTAGGHRRLPVASVLEFVRERGLELVDATILGLPAATGSGPRTLERSQASLVEAFRNGSFQAALRVLVDLYLASYSLSQIFDLVMRPSLIEVGHQWRTGEMEIYEERRSVEFCSRILHELSRLQPPVDASGPKAIGGTLDGDPYTTAAKMAELVLRSVGYRATSLGNELPFSTIEKAIEIEKPRLIWLSVSSIRHPEVFTDRMNRLHEMCQERGVLLALGGGALTEERRSSLRFDSYSETMHHLERMAAEQVERLREDRQIG